MEYLEIIGNINKALLKANEVDKVKLINNAKIKGGTPGEVVAIVSSLLKVFEKKFPDVFSLIHSDANLLFKMSKESGMSVKPNYGLLEELNWD